MPAPLKCAKRRLRGGLLVSMVATLLLGLPVPSSASDVEGECLLRLIAEPLELQLTYDAFAVGNTLQTTRLRLENLADRPCRILLEPQSHGSGRIEMALANTSLRGELFVGTDRRSLQEMTTGRPLEFLMPANGRQSLEIGMRLQPGAFPMPGSYADGLSLALRDRDTGQLALEELLVRIHIEVPTRVQLNLAGSDPQRSTGNGAHVVDFGELETGAQRAVNLQVRANQTYRVSFRSENRGQLRRPAWPQEPGIDYRLVVAGRSTDLSAPLELSMPRPMTPDGINLPIHIHIGEVGSYLAGTYEDVVHVSVLAHY